MNKYEKAALLFGQDGSAGEAGAISNYLQFVGALLPSDGEVIDNVLERVADELNHLLGDTLDAIKMAGLYISKDGIDEILDGLKAAVEK